MAANGDAMVDRARSQVDAAALVIYFSELCLPIGHCCAVQKISLFPGISKGNVAIKELFWLERLIVESPPQISARQ